MGWTGPLPDNILRRMPKEDRRPLGKAGVTTQEANEKAVARSEKKLQENVAALLRQRNITFNVSRMDKRKTDKVGWPDFTFAVRGRAAAFEVKRPGKEPTKEQVACMLGMIRDGWFVRVIESEHQALQALNELSSG